MIKINICYKLKSIKLRKKFIDLLLIFFLFVYSFNNDVFAAKKKKNKNKSSRRSASSSRKSNRRSGSSGSRRVRRGYGSNFVRHIDLNDFRSSSFGYDNVRRQETVNTSLQHYNKQELKQNDEPKTNTKKQDMRHPGQLSAFTGNFFKSSDFTFVEGKPYPFSDFVRNDIDELRVDATMYTCGITVKAPDAYFQGPMQPFFDKSGDPFSQDEAFIMKKEDLKNSFITFREGAADTCTSIPEAKAFVFEFQGKRDKLTFTIKKKNHKQLMQVEKSMFDKMKNDCLNIDMKTPFDQIRNLIESIEKCKSSISVLKSL